MLSRKERRNIPRQFKLTGTKVKDIKNDLEAFKCEWNPKLRAYITPKMSPLDRSYRHIAGIALAFDVQMIPFKNESLLNYT